MNRSDFAHFTTLPVQWGDMDAIGHVNNTIYFRYVESGRIAYFKFIGATSSDASFEGEAPIMADIQCSFLGQLRYPATIDIGTRTSRIGTKSLEIEAGIFVQGEDTPVATSRGVIVWFDYKSQRSAPIPDELRERIVALENVKPEGA